MNKCCLFLACFAFALSTAPAAGAPSSPAPRVEVSSPEIPRFRTVSPEEIQRKYEEILKQSGEESGKEGAKPAPTPLAGPAPLRPTPLAFAPIPAAGAAAGKPLPAAAFSRTTPDTARAPEWTPDWKRARQSFAQRDALSEVELDYQWEGILASVRLIPSDPLAAPVRLFFRQPGKENLQLAPGMYRLEVDLWLAGDLAPFSVYRFSGQELEEGYVNELIFPNDLTKDLRMHLVMSKEREASSFRRPVVTPRAVNVPLGSVNLAP